MSVPSDTAEITRSFRRGFATLFAVDLLNKCVTAVTVVVLIRGLSVPSYAYVTVLFTLAQFSGSAAGGGILTRYLREESERLSRGGEVIREELFVNALVKATLLIAILGVCTIPLVQTFGFGSDSGGSAKLALFATVFAAGFTATDLAVARFQARRSFFRAGILSVIRALALLAAALTVTETSENQLQIGAWLAASMIVVGLLTAGRIAAKAAVSSHTSSRLSLLGFSREDGWLSLWSVAGAGFAYVDVLVAGALLTHYEVAALGASLRYWALVLSAIPALGAVLRVRTSQVDIVDSPSNQRTMVLSWIRRTTIPAAVLVAVVAALAPVVIPLIDGGKYPKSVEVFQIFLVTAFIAYVTAPAGITLLAQRRYAALAAIYGGGLLLNLFGDLAVARPFGIVGIAIVSSTVYVGIGLAATVESLRYTGASPRDTPFRNNAS
jgi:O-antigen/teichoic acid export membrane protein